MSGSSSVGQASVYEAGDQRNSKESENKHAERYHEGQKNSHLANDSSYVSLLIFPLTTYFDIFREIFHRPSFLFSRHQISLVPIERIINAANIRKLTEDQRSIANKLGAAEHDAGGNRKEISKEAQEAKQDPTLPVNPSPPLLLPSVSKKKRRKEKGLGYTEEREELLKHSYTTN